MAHIGLRYCYAAPVEELIGGGNPPTYGKGFHVGRMINADETVNFGNNPLYADDRMVNNNTDFVDGTLTLVVDEFGDKKTDMLEIRSKLTGEAYEAGEGDLLGTIGLGEIRNETPVGIGFVKSGEAPDGGGKYYVMTWYHRVIFKPGSESATTRGNSITWQTPTIEGDIYTIPEMDPKNNIRFKEAYATEAAALKRLKELANYTEDAESEAEPETLSAKSTSYRGGSSEEDQA